MNTAEEIFQHTEECNARLEEMGEGPWRDEPHYVHFKEFGLDCLIVRNRSLFFWCGYVGVSPSHPAFGKRYEDVEDKLDVHGGLTYSEPCRGTVCHIPQPGEPDDLYWFGFDCGHSNDLAPGMLATDRKMKVHHPELFGKMEEHHLSGVYRDMKYVMNETKALARQLSWMK